MLTTDTKFQLDRTKFKRTTAHPGGTCHMTIAANNTRYTENTACMFSPVCDLGHITQPLCALIFFHYKGKENINIKVIPMSNGLIRSFHRVYIINASWYTSLTYTRVLCLWIFIKEKKEIPPFVTVQWTYRIWSQTQHSTSSALKCSGSQSSACLLCNISLF